MLPKNFDPFGDPQLDEYEKELEASIERGEWKSVPNLEEVKQKMKAAVEYTWELRKAKNVNFRLQGQDLMGLKNRARQKGIRYQTLLSTLVHQYVNGQIEVRL